MNDKKNVVSLSVVEPVAKIKDSNRGWCRSSCQDVLVDMKLRVVTCRDCGSVVDPLNWVFKMAQEESYLLQRIRNLKAEHELHADTVEKLKEEEQRIKSRIRTAKNSFLNSTGIH